MAILRNVVHVKYACHVQERHNFFLSSSCVPLMSLRYGFVQIIVYIPFEITDDIWIGRLESEVWKGCPRQKYFVSYSLSVLSILVILPYTSISYHFLKCGNRNKSPVYNQRNKQRMESVKHFLLSRISITWLSAGRNVLIWKADTLWSSRWFHIFFNVLTFFFI